MGALLPLLVDLSAADAPRFQAIDDRVMGGRSRSRLRRTDDGTGIFEGLVSMESGGGFASVRGLVPETDLSAAKGVSLRVRGDGRRYRLVLRSDRGFSGVNYLQAFQPSAGEWEEVRLPFEGFEASLRGQRPSSPRPLDTRRIRQVGLMIADRQAGPFRLEVAWIRGWDGS